MLNRNHSEKSLIKKTGMSLGAIALGLTTLVLPACNNNEEIREGRDNATTEDVSEIGENGSDIVGKEITIRSQVEETVGNTGFVLQSQAGEEILVINSTGADFRVPAIEVPVQVTGEAVELVVADVENEYGLDLEDELYVDYEQQPAIIAESLALAPTPEDLAEVPNGYFNQEIAVEGQVRELDSPNAFALFEDGWVDDYGVLVIGISRNLKAEDSPIQEGENVTVTGVAREFDGALLEQEAAELGWTDEDIAEFESRYSNRPVIVADSIYPSAIDNK
ncbi:hypothetical protein [Oscillatoria salina]|uniref:hypothetical protein n=1 Tax=Oscillatoria salina TaxID=331517 RepID=UPI0013B8F11C|nr:hypothetical protein [Oscillatoria salina]MBZ8183111.1 hypothetical protein [Oscillatoria salina IIICB1]NET88029.1 hypothetical protein [Kamptonema sp. SIO1D9]